MTKHMSIIVPQRTLEDVAFLELLLIRALLNAFLENLDSVLIQGGLAHRTVSSRCSGGVDRG